MDPCYVWYSGTRDPVYRSRNSSIDFNHIIPQVQRLPQEGFEVLAAVITNFVIFWDIGLCIPHVNRRFGGKYRLHLHSPATPWFLLGCVSNHTFLPINVHNCVRLTLRKFVYAFTFLRFVNFGPPSPTFRFPRQQTQTNVQGPAVTLHNSPHQIELLSYISNYEY
jgi:hypothetical protein